MAFLLYLARQLTIQMVSAIGFFVDVFANNKMSFILYKLRNVRRNTDAHYIAWNPI